MSAVPTKPGQRCRVVGSRMAFNGEGRGPNQGKVVTTMFLHAEKAGIEQENVWHCRGETWLQTYYGVGTEADFLECWLEVIEADFLECWLEVIEPDAEPPLAATTDKEITA